MRLVTSALVAALLLAVPATASAFQRSGSATDPVGDSAGLPGGAAVMRGARAVGAHALGFSRSAQFVEPALVNGAMGFAIVPQGRLMGALGFTFSGGKITEIDIAADPQRLRRFSLAVLD